MKLSLVVPCYNEEENVERFFDEVNKVFLCNVEDYEFVFVNDGSKDATFEKATILQAVSIVLKDALELMGINAPEQM